MGQLSDAYSEALTNLNLSYASPLRLTFALQLSTNHHEEQQELDKAIEIAD